MAGSGSFRFYVLDFPSLHIILLVSRYSCLIIIIIIIIIIICNNNNNNNQTTVEETKNIVIRNKHSRQYCAFWIGTGFLPLLSTIYMEILEYQIERKNCKYIYITFLQII